MDFDNYADRLRREILIRVARAAYGDDPGTELNHIPVVMRPRQNGMVSRCCIYKDRAVIKYRCMAALGYAIEEETDETRPLSDYYREAQSREQAGDGVLTIINEACTGCIRSRYVATDACRGCIAHPCMINCPREAIRMEHGRAVIDPAKCINCGICMKACPYHAIIRVPIPCEEVCPVGAINKDEQGRVAIDFEKCIFCGKCAQACPFAAIIDRSQMLDVLQALRGARPVTLMIAPAIVGQYPGTMNQLAAALKRLGFDHVLELEKFVSHTPSPMALLAERLKRETPGMLTVFAGPCIAKRSEAIQNPDVDLVLTFDELGAMLIAAGVDVQQVEEEAFEEPAGRDGRGFAASGGVTSAIRNALGETSGIQTELIDGLDKKALDMLRGYVKKGCPSQFLEVMSCAGGCVAGPRTLVAPRKAAAKLKEFIS